MCLFGVRGLKKYNRSKNRKIEKMKNRKKIDCFINAFSFLAFQFSFFVYAFQHPDQANEPWDKGFIQLLLLLIS